MKSLELLLKGILSLSANFLCVKELILMSSETYFVSISEAPFPSKSGKILCTEDWLPER